MDVARIRLRSNGYDVFNAVVTANINDSLFHIKMVEEWCGPLQWLDNRCCKKYADDGDCSDSDESNGGALPLFTAKEDRCCNYDEEGEEGKEDYENESEKFMGFDEESFVQETISVFEENLGNDYANNGEKIPIVNAEVGKGMELNGGSLKSGEENLVMVVGEECETAHDKFFEKSGAQPESNETSMQNGGGVNVIDDMAVTQGGMSNVVGCEKQLNGHVDYGDEELGHQVVPQENEGAEILGPSIMVMKKKKKTGFGPVKRKLNEKRKKKIKAKVQSKAQQEEVPVNHLPVTIEDQPCAASLSLQCHGGVVRNPIGDIKPSSSWSISSSTAGSHVESIGDSGILMGNNRFDAEMERIKATKLWRLAKDKLGVSAADDEDEMFIERLRALEEKAKAEKSRKGNKKGSK